MLFTFLVIKSFIVLLSLKQTNYNNRGKSNREACEIAYTVLKRPNIISYGTVEYFLELPTYLSRVTGVRTAEAIKTRVSCTSLHIIHLAYGTTGFTIAGDDTF